MLIKGIYEVDPLPCAECGGQMDVETASERGDREDPALLRMDRARRSDSEPKELTCVDIDMFLANF